MGGVQLWGRLSQQVRRAEGGLGWGGKLAKGLCVCDTAVREEDLLPAALRTCRGRECSRWV